MCMNMDKSKFGETSEEEKKIIIIFFLYVNNNCWDYHLYTLAIAYYCTTHSQNFSHYFVFLQCTRIALGSGRFWRADFFSPSHIKKIMYIFFFLSTQKTTRVYLSTNNLYNALQQQLGENSSSSRRCWAVGNGSGGS